MPKRRSRPKLNFWKFKFIIIDGLLVGYRRNQFLLCPFEKNCGGALFNVKYGTFSGMETVTKTIKWVQILHNGTDYSFLSCNGPIKYKVAVYSCTSVRPYCASALWTACIQSITDIFYYYGRREPTCLPATWDWSSLRRAACCLLSLGKKGDSHLVPRSIRE